MIKFHGSSMFIPFHVLGTRSRAGAESTLETHLDDLCRALHNAKQNRLFDEMDDIGCNSFAFKDPGRSI